MGMNIKNPETHRLARELAALTGESQTTAITKALRERLERVRGDDSPSERLQKMREIARDCASRMTEDEKAIDIDDLLYDENGLPK